MNPQEEKFMHYVLSSEHQTAIADQIIAKLQTDEISKAFKKAITEQVDAAVDSLTDYIKDEYQLLLADMVRQRAIDHVRELLKGSKEAMEFFNLGVKFDRHGEEFVYDGHGCRKAIYEAFRDEIEKAEMVDLRQEAARLKESLKWARSY